MKILNYLKLHIWLPACGCVVVVVFFVIAFIVLKPQFTNIFPFISISIGGTTGGNGLANGTGSAGSQPEISDMALKMWVDDASKDTIISKTDVAKYGLYASEFTFKVTNSAALSRVKISLVNSQGVTINDKLGSPLVRIPDDNGLPEFAKTNPTAMNTYGQDKVAGDGIYTSDVTGELADYSGWCSFPEGQYQLKVDVTVSSSKLHNVTANYPIFIAKNCE